MTPFVVDASVAATWCLADESPPAVVELLNRVKNSGAVVPGMWFAEIANVLLMAERRGRLKSDAVSEYLTLLGTLQLEVEADSGSRIHLAVVPLARRHKLTVYDAMYLEIALRRGFPLATLDHELVRAAASEKVPTLPV
ncbi:MAG: type II toxin-antitoxin system VapC family toxin [Phycisphaeraceae bacterium]|nr:type II toxin-antitoxin system VapC family toxin [Phycisphaeraceae bacterium]